MNLSQSIESNRVLLGYDFVEKSDDEILEMCGINFLKVMNRVREMKDTFGLCGILAIHGAGCMSDPRWQEVYYKPQMYKEISDNSWKSGNGRAGVYQFFDDFKALLGVVSSTGVPGVRGIWDGFDNPDYDQKQGNTVAMVCDYPEYNGVATHWLALGGKVGDRVVVVGDLKPFGLDSVAIEMSIDVLRSSVNKVIGQQFTVYISSQILSQQSNHKSGNGNGVFDYNWVRFSFGN